MALSSMHVEICRLFASEIDPISAFEEVTRRFETPQPHRDHERHSLALVTEARELLTFRWSGLLAQIALSHVAWLLKWNVSLWRDAVDSN